MVTLIRAGADVNIGDKDGSTPIMKATNYPEFSEKLLQQFFYAGAKVNIVNGIGYNALEDYLVNAETIVERIAMMLYVAGEKLDFRSMVYHRTRRLYKGRNDFPEFLFNIVNNQEEGLMSICRAAIRTHLLEVDSVNLFVRIPSLKLPSLLTEFLLYDVSLDDDDDDVSDND